MARGVIFDWLLAWGSFCFCKAWAVWLLAGVFLLIVRGGFGGVVCVARGICCVVCHWFWRLAGARGEIVCFGCWLVMIGARFCRGAL